MNIGKQLKEGFITQNPVLVQLLGMCSLAKDSARARMTQLTTMRGMNTPRLSAISGKKAWSSRSTMVTKPAMTTI